MSERFFPEKHRVENEGAMRAVGRQDAGEAGAGVVWEQK